MPLYEYECKACHRRTEKRQKFSDPEITECPFCGGELERVISAPAIAFKGGGWYADGYGNAKPKAANSEGKSDAAPAASGDAAKKSGGGEGASSGGPAPAASTPTSAPASSPAPSSPSSAAPNKS